MCYLLRALLTVGLVAAIGLAGSAGRGIAQDAPDSAARSSDRLDGAPMDQETSPDASLFGVMLSLGVTGLSIVLLLLVLSTVAVALSIEHLISIRRTVFMPPGLADGVRQSLTAGKLGPADQLCGRQPSILSFVLRAGFSETDGGWTAVEKGMEEALAQQSARLFRKIETLSVIGNIAPMLGLLGTVTGMIFAFQEVADTQGAARAAQLAEGIYTALVTTVAGLVVAIPSLAAFAIFRNRVDELVAEVAYVAHHAVSPLKRAALRRAAPGAR